RTRRQRAGSATANSCLSPPDENRTGCETPGGRTRWDRPPGAGAGYQPLRALPSSGMQAFNHVAAEMLVDTVRTLPSPTAQTITLGCGEVGEFGWQNPFGGLAQNGIVLLCRKSIRELFMPHSFCRTGALDRRRK